MPLGNLILVALCCIVVSFDSSAKKISYQQHIKPIIDNKCIVCHACFDAPCQLVLTHGEGLLRGANKQRVYDGLRVEPVAPTGLFIDALSTDDWRQKAFFSVLAENKKPEDINKNSASKTGVLTHLLSMRESYIFKPNSRLPETMRLGLKHKNICPASDEINDYKKSRPHGGMPFGVTGLSNIEYQTLLDWIKQGAHIDPAAIHTSSENNNL